MKMKRYFAADTRTAMRKLRQEQGPEAVILSNRCVSGGVEIIAALDYEDALVNASLGNPYTDTNLAMDPVHATNTSAKENTSQGLTLGNIQNELKGLRNIMEAPLMQMSWGEMTRVQPLQANLLKQLMMLGLDSELSKKIIKQVSVKAGSKQSWLIALKMLANLLPISNDDLMQHGGVVSLVGPTGVGKTTTIAKLAARFAFRHGRRSVCLVTTDSYRIGAHEQLRTYGRILSIPVHVATDRDELRTVLNHNSEHKLTLIDTAGMSQRDLKLSEQLATLDIGDKKIKNYLVLSATAQMNLQDDVIQAFKEIGLHGCILTKLDEAASLGESLSVLIRHKLAVAFISDGQKVPDNLHPARGTLLVKEAVKLMKNAKKTLSNEQLAYTFGGTTINASS